MNLSGLRQLGWVTKDKEYNYDFSADKITVTRYVPFGYSNLPLYFMYRRSSDKTQRKTFNPLPPQYAPQLRNYLKGMMSYLGSNGRQWYYPGGSYSSPEYQSLRPHLHFSSKLSIGSYPSYDHTKILNGQLISRFVYYGNKGDSVRRYMSDYLS